MKKKLKFIFVFTIVFLELFSFNVLAVNVKTPSNSTKNTTNTTNTSTNSSTKNTSNTNTTSSKDNNKTSKTQSTTSELSIDSEAAILAESTTGIIAYEKNADTKMYPASTTKILTAILVIEKCKLSDIVTVDSSALESIPSGYVTGNIVAGEQLTVEDLLYTLMLKSANDVAVVLAQHVSGSVDKFAELMNSKAKELGCKNSHFVNPNGIHDENHYSTAFDLALIASYCMENETFKKIVSTEKYTLPKTNKYTSANRSFSNTNELIIPSSKYYYEYATGIKTGYTKEAKSCLIASSTKDNISFISVVLGGNSSSSGKDTRFIDTKNLFEYGYNNFKFTEFKKANEVITKIEIENATKETKDLNLKIEKGIISFNTINFDFDSLKPKIELNENIKAPIEANTVLGTISYTINGIEYKSNLLAATNVEKKTYYWIILLTIVIVLGLGFLIINITKKIKNKKNSKNKSKKKKNRARLYKR